MMQERWAKPELPRHEQFLTSGMPEASDPSSRHSQQLGLGDADAASASSSAIAVLVLLMHTCSGNMGWRSVVIIGLLLLS